MRRYLVLCLALLLAARAPAAASAVHGRELATRLGCASCHTATFQGSKQIDDPTIATFYSANLTRAVPRYDDAALERVIRTGVRPDGSHLWYMAAAPYAVLSRGDMADLIAFLRMLPSGGEDHPRLVMGPRFLRAVKAGRVKPESLSLAEDLRHPPVDLGPPHARGRYLARTICAGCHQADLAGISNPQPGDAPDLTIAAAYDREAFTTLLRTGKASGGRELDVMSAESRKRFAGLGDADIAVLHAYLVARAAAATR